MSIELDFENASVSAAPEESDFLYWVSAALSEKFSTARVSVRLVDEVEMTSLNNQFRDQNKSTNVLSFPAEIPACIQKDLELNLLGDIAICAPVIEREASEQNKALSAHYAHMSVHGALHLAGYDHIKQKDAEEMEALEISILKKLGFSNPYELQ